MSDSTNLDLAMMYMDIFFAGKDLARLSEILAPDLQFLGPFYQFNSAQAYVESLLQSPPIDCEYKLLNSFTNKTSVNLIYEFIKPGISTPMSQLFEISNHKIARILLIFDSGQFVNP